ncbi:hypothetical protein AAC387_Pa12g2234 [Persea americana]
MADVLIISLVTSALLIFSWIWRLFWWKPKKLERYLRQQGLKGPTYRFLVGTLREEFSLSNDQQSKPMDLSHAIVPHVVPFIHRTVKEYGKMPLTWFGSTPTVNIMDPELIREVLTNKFGHFEKLTFSRVVKVLVTGLVSHQGEKWAKHRRIINPAFHQEKLKRMLPAVHTSCYELITRWEESIGSDGTCELDVWPEFQNLTGDVISRTAFGSSYKEGMKIFQHQTEQARLLIQSPMSTIIPGYRFFPTKVNVRRNKIEKEVRSLLRHMIEQREKEMKMGNVSNDDLLGLLMESNFKDSQEQENSDSIAMTIEDVIDECKLFYFAGQETTAILLTWTMVALCIDKTWQMQAREEVLQVFGKNKPDFDGINRLKIVTMILYEVLRLYPPAVVIARSTYKNVKLGDISLPPGVQVHMPVLLLHHDPEIWGEDADEFKPERFSEGVSKASKNQVVFFPFGWGPRICVGQNFAMIEAKIALAMILQRFAFELSPSYAHTPYNFLTLQPRQGAQIILRRL